MASSVANRLEHLPAKKLAKAGLAGETDAKFLGARQIAGLLERCFEHSHLTEDQAAREMGYADGSTVSAWKSGKAPFNFLRLWNTKLLRAGWIAALAEDAGDAVEIETRITLKRLA